MTDGPEIRDLEEISLKKKKPASLHTYNYNSKWAHVHPPAYREGSTRAAEPVYRLCLRQGASWPDHVLLFLHSLPPSRHPQSIPNTNEHLIEGTRETRCGEGRGSFTYPNNFLFPMLYKEYPSSPKLIKNPVLAGDKLQSKSCEKTVNSEKRFLPYKVILGG